MPFLIILRYWKRIPDPLLGPKGVRTLLVIRGFSGCVLSWYACGLVNDSCCRHRFFTLSGVYFSLQYLSLSDATVLTFMAPVLTSFAGAVFLKESLSAGETLAGCEHLNATPTVIATHRVIVCSFLGVVLIARPQFLFGSLQQFLDSPDGSPVVTPTERMSSVMSELSRPVSRCSSHVIE